QEERSKLRFCGNESSVHHQRQHRLYDDSWVGNVPAGAATAEPSLASFTDVVNPEIIVLMLCPNDYTQLYSVLFQAFMINGNANAGLAPTALRSGAGRSSF